MNLDAVVEHLCEHGYTASQSDDAKRLLIKHVVADHTLTLVHYVPDALERLPQFILLNATSLGMLAHVEPRKDKDYALICVNEPDSVSVNYDVPEAAYRDSVEWHLELLERAITDPAWNRAELLREFRSNWDLLAHFAGTDKDILYFASEPNTQPTIQVKRPYNPKWQGIHKQYLGLDQSLFSAIDDSSFRSALYWDRRSAAGKAILLHLEDLYPAPREPGTVAEWLCNCIDHLTPESAARLRGLRKQRAKEFWLVFTARNDEDRVWFAVRALVRGKGKKPVPMNAEQCADWKLHPIPVRALDRGSIVPRSGGDVTLADKSVLLVGCGSVGSELAHRLASTGVGNITLSDPQSFSQDNLYRHSLSIVDIGYGKSLSLAGDLRRKYPWIRAKHLDKKLQDFSDVDELSGYDLIVVSIGSPTIERRFHDFVAANDIDTPVLNVWLEAYGVGGHATLALPNQPGCLLCAYVDPDELCRGLASNLNFLEPNQDFTISMGGCGNLFLPYSAIASNHTATMAADLAVKNLQGKTTESSRVSWKGDAAAAEAAGLKVSYRYARFDDNLVVQNLRNPECDDCG